MARPLTKSRFKVGAECPTKLYYSARPEYGNKNDKDDFLRALAEGGFQVGELAKLYYSGGVMVDTLDSKTAIEQTNELLKKENVTIFEAAFQHENLLIRVDVLQKIGNVFKVIEVKAKSYHSDEDDLEDIFDKRSLKAGKYVLKGDYIPYLLDIAFQTHVVSLAFPKASIEPYLMLPDKSATATVDGLNQLFLIEKDERGRAKVVLTRQVTPNELGEPILVPANLTNQVDLIINKAELEFGPTFKELVANLSHWQASGERCPPPVGIQCKTCEYRITKTDFGPESKSGFEECWKTAKQLKEQDFERPFVFDVWDFKRAAGVLDDKTFAEELSDSDVGLKSRDDDKIGLSRTERQLLQIRAAAQANSEPFFDHEGFAEEIADYPKPYHFIDFETNMVAIPFHKGRRPYEQIAFQFSHHLMQSDGTFEHKTEYLNVERGVFPNFDFVRALRKAIGNEGTVFRFAAHENTVLNQIHEQLERSNETDRDDLMAWIESLTTPPDKRKGEWTPTRNFVDMRDLVLRFMYLPETKGSNSIKKVLPAILNLSSAKFRNRFAEWIKTDESGQLQDPYKLLPPIFTDVAPAELEKVERFLIDRDELNDGGAAMMAWSRMQFTEMSNTERDALKKALLQYCHLDTLAMVMIWEWWRDEINDRRLRKTG